VGRKSNLNIGLFDFEMSNLNADFGILLCGVVKDFGRGKKGEHIFRIDDTPGYRKSPWDDHKLATDLRDALVPYDIIVSYNGRRFDVPFLNTRLTIYDEKPLMGLKHVDLLYVVKYGLHLHSASLESAQQFFNLPEEKSKIEAARWIKALTGNKEDMDYIVDHCKRDVAVLEAVFNRTKHLIRSIHV